ncbi:hypothetical protein E6O75_ATG01358 [Venturia nashicola]|uniref:Cell wall mannoprotein PIR1-like C-terminal domain-containing protein n=1 Tax=Venturia nashicola TaxID=86259 RepID=A0A4Z1PRU7_9PEZI|nr:hypothetical protein E6O75_ATG01358 [Venturia nashicola]
MRSSYVLGSLALAASNALAAPQGVTASIAPQAPPPPGCSQSHSVPFQITVQNVTTGSKVKRDVLESTLSGGVLKDSLGRTGYIADNGQFQYDGPPQAGAIFTAGFSLCANGSLALGGSAIWYQCLSGGFYNLYDRSWAPQCSPIYIVAIGYSSSAAVTQATDGQPIATPAVSQQSDGQVIANSETSKPVSQIGDGQIQNPVSQISDGQLQVPSANPVQQISDGQIQAHTPATDKPVSESSDGQIVTTPVNTSAHVTGAPVSQISDGQIQVTTPNTPANVTGTPVSQIPDGQIQAAAPTKAAGNASNMSATYTPAQVSVNAASLQTAGSLAVAGFFAVVATFL